MKDIIELLKVLLAGIIPWLSAVASPVSNVNRWLAIEKDEERTALLVSIWLWSLLVGLIFHAPLYRMVGIEFGDVGFYAANAFTTSLSLLIFAWITHQLLLLLGLKSVLFETITIFIGTMVIYSPVWTIALLPMNAQTFLQMRELKKLQLPLDEAILRLFTDAQATYQTSVQIVVAIATPISFCTLFAATALFGNYTVQWYKNSRYKTFSTLVISWTVSAIVIMISVGLLNMFVLWSYMK